jgi:hypothetical protein
VSEDDLEALAARLAAGAGLVGKADIAAAVGALGVSGGSPVPVGDDAAAIPMVDGWSLLACEGMLTEFVQALPWFAGWSAVMVNLADIAAMGGRPVALVNALWAAGVAEAAPLLAGMRAASAAYGVPVVGGHTNLRAAGGQLAVAVLGQARALMTSFDAAPGEVLIAALDLRGRYHEPYPFYDAATAAPPARLRGDLALLPQLAEDGLCAVAKDISQGGLIGTAAMLAECSGVGLEIEIDAVPRPADAELERWLATFPSYGFLLTARAEAAARICARFAARDLAAAPVGRVAPGGQLALRAGGQRAVVRDLAAAPLIGCGAGPAAARRHA